MHSEITTKETLKLERPLEGISKNLNTKLSTLFAGVTLACSTVGQAAPLTQSESDGRSLETVREPMQAVPEDQRNSLFEQYLDLRQSSSERREVWLARLAHSSMETKARDIAEGYNARESSLEFQDRRQDSWNSFRFERRDEAAHFEGQFERHRAQALGRVDQENTRFRTRLQNSAERFREKVDKELDKAEEEFKQVVAMVAMGMAGAGGADPSTVFALAGLAQSSSESLEAETSAADLGQAAAPDPGAEQETNKSASLIQQAIKGGEAEKVSGGASLSTAGDHQDISWEKLESLFAPSFEPVAFVNMSPSPEVYQQLSKDGRVELCTRPADLPINIGGIVPHDWIKVPGLEAGLGPDGGGVPGGDTRYRDKLPYITQTSVNSHEGQAALLGSTCEPVPNINEICVREELELGRKHGRWTFTNTCIQFAKRVLDKCRVTAD